MKGKGIVCVITLVCAIAVFADLFDFVHWQVDGDLKRLAVVVFLGAWAFTFRKFLWRWTKRLSNEAGRFLIALRENWRRREERLTSQTGTLPMGLLEKWRRPEPWRKLGRWLWTIGVVILLVWMVWNLKQLGTLLFAGEKADSGELGMGALLRLATGIAPPTMASTLFSLGCNLWGLMGAWWLRRTTFGAAAVQWDMGRRVMVGSLALIYFVGRFAVAWLDYLVALAAPFVPDHWLLNVAWFFVLPPLALPTAGALALWSFIETVGWVVAVGFSAVVFIFNQFFQFENMVHIYRYKRTGLIQYLVRIGYWLRGEKPPEGPDDTKGARFATADEVGKMQNEKGSAFGRYENESLKLHTEKHVLIMASTRSGKGVSLIIPHLLTYPASAFVLDPKAENAKATGRQRAALNGKVYYLDPFGISGKPQARFNPLSRFTPDNMEAESKALAGALMIGAGGYEDRNHWVESGKQLLAALILYVFLSPDVPEENKDLCEVRHILLSGINATMDKMLDMADAAGGLLADLAASFLRTPDKELGSIISAAQRETEILDNPYIQRCVAASGEGPEVDFAEWHKGTMTVYLCLSAPKFPVFNRWLRLVLTAALDEMTDSLNPPALPVCFVLDELATLGHLATVENAVGLGAGYGVQLYMVFQDVAQMRDLYKGRWASFIGNAGIRALFNLDDYNTADYWSKFVGGHQVETVSQQQDIYGLTQGQNVGENVRPLISPDEIMLRYAGGSRMIGGKSVFVGGKMLILAEGARPAETERVAYFDDPRFEGLWDDPRAKQTTEEPARRNPEQSPTPPPQKKPAAVQRTTEPTTPQPQQEIPANVGQRRPNAVRRQVMMGGYEKSGGFCMECGEPLFKTTKPNTGMTTELEFCIKCEFVYPAQKT